MVGADCCCSGANDTVDPLEDENKQLLWSWELRDPKILLKSQRQQAQAIKKGLLKVVLCTSAHAKLQLMHLLCMCLATRHLLPVLLCWACMLRLSSANNDSMCLV